MRRAHRQQSSVRTVLGAIFDVWESAKKWLSCVKRVWWWAWWWPTRNFATVGARTVPRFLARLPTGDWLASYPSVPSSSYRTAA